MKVIIRSKSIEFEYENKEEKEHLRQVLDRVQFLFKPEIMTWNFGKCIVGRINE